jgi:hypothetical protein
LFPSEAGPKLKFWTSTLRFKGKRDLKPAFPKSLWKTIGFFHRLILVYKFVDIMEGKPFFESLKGTSKNCSF